LNRLNTAFHNVLVHISMGAFFLLPVLLVALWWVRKQGGRQELERQIDAAIYILLLLGLGGIPVAVLGIMVDYPDWRALLLSPLVRIKASLTFLAFEVFLMAYYLRWRYGQRLWAVQPLAGYFAVLTLLGFCLVGLVGSIGGFLAIRETALEKLLPLLGIPVP
jgi:glucan phosphoethanolaminetransferase (alkaline phosphatase superfamily)